MGIAPVRKGSHKPIRGEAALVAEDELAPKQPVLNDDGARIEAPVPAMKTAGRRPPRRVGKIVSLAIVAACVYAGYLAVQRAANLPSTDDATIDADVVHVASTVGGRIVKIAVAENALVAEGDLLFQIDPVPYQLAVDQAQADLDLAEASLDTQRRALATQQSAAKVAHDQVERAETNLDLATRSVDRLRPLAVKSYVPAQQLDQAEVARRDAITSLQQAREQEVAAVHAIGTTAATEAAVKARGVALAIAKRALEDATVHAAHAGRVAGLTVSSGEIVAPSQTLFTLVNTEDWFAVANFREFDLHAIAAGDCATVYSMIDRERPIKGVVDGIGWGVLDTDRINLPRSVPLVERSLNWVRVAQRFPIRVRLEKPDQMLMRLGASAVVEVKHGSACG
ncbi:multidrug transporter subunit MdtN [Telmatospirillum sp.]|uniref:multidrug transporter subunit MdtN n=1 Tax=Telmatospirillum sp. TaxID=2079197 RepID=UPI00283DF38F|nr:multidrug transporter subunit MdtN [Telmatospirillum sp.]MDR3437334.1 multidrug transporter subunit MdtN [Telmatospirillum sp.]